MHAFGYIVQFYIEIIAHFFLFYAIFYNANKYFATFC
jgi:hypothetical protein